MTANQTILAAATGIALLLTAPVQAGGPVIIENTESAPVIVQDKRDNTALLILGGIIVLGLFAGGGPSENCFAPEPETKGGNC